MPGVPRREQSLVWGGVALVAGIACGSSALATNAQLHSGQAFTLGEIELMSRRAKR